MLVSEFITKLRRFSRDIPVLTRELFDGDASTIAFRVKYAPILEGEYTVKISDVTQVEDTDYTIDRDSGVILFTSAPASANDNVSVTYKYTKLSDTEWLEIFNSIIEELRLKLWTDNFDDSSLTTVKDQDEYDLDTISEDIIKVLSVRYKTDSSIVDWSDITTAGINAKYVREQNKLNLRPVIQSDGWLLKIRYLQAYGTYSATTDTITHPERYLKPIRYFCQAAYIEELMNLMVRDLGANVKKDTYQPLNNLIRLKREFESRGEKLLARVKPRMPSTSIPIIQRGMK